MCTRTTICENRITCLSFLRGGSRLLFIISFYTSGRPGLLFLLLLLPALFVTRPLPIALITLSIPAPASPCPLCVPVIPPIPLLAAIPFPAAFPFISASISIPVAFISATLSVPLVAFPVPASASATFLTVAVPIFPSIPIWTEFPVSTSAASHEKFTTALQNNIVAPEILPRQMLSICFLAGRQTKSLYCNFLRIQLDQLLTV
jgi:hypothetical protein